MTDTLHTSPSELGRLQRDRTRHIELLQVRLGTTKSATILSALGHPGYGEAMATKALKLWVTSDLDLHEVIYDRYWGGR